ncbi:MAG: hypothetical protein PHV30_10715 [Candidatus Margulisbacteria bacterium]|nr:hypothetical protein [Candidatus Margulisiibacteriota bacterium]
MEDKYIHSCSQSEKIGKLISAQEHFTLWQKTQNGRLDAMDKKLWGIIILLVGVLASSLANLLF